MCDDKRNMLYGLAARSLALKREDQLSRIALMGKQNAMPLSFHKPQKTIRIPASWLTPLFFIHTGSRCLPRLWVNGPRLSCLYLLPVVSAYHAPLRNDSVRSLNIGGVQGPSSHAFLQKKNRPLNPRWLVCGVLSVKKRGRGEGER